MGKLTTKHGDYEYTWTSDVEFDGLRLEITDLGGEHWFDGSVPEDGVRTVYTFSREVPADLVLAALALAEERA